MITGCMRSQNEADRIGDKDMDNKYEVEVTINEDLEDTRTSIDMERIKAWRLEWSINELHLIGGKYNLDYIFSGFTIPANYDVDWQTIERFAFAYRGFHGSVGFVIDRMHGRVYFDPFPDVRFLNVMQYFANFRKEDLARLINVIERSNLRNWQEFYEGEFNEVILDGSAPPSWEMGILFANGSILRSGGRGDRNYLPPEDEFAILFNFIETLGEEIIQRHELERLVE